METRDKRLEQKSEGKSKRRAIDIVDNGQYPWRHAISQYLLPNIYDVSVGTVDIYAFCQTSYLNTTCWSNLLCESVSKIMNASFSFEFHWHSNGLIYSIDSNNNEVEIDNCLNCAISLYFIITISNSSLGSSVEHIVET